MLHPRIQTKKDLSTKVKSLRKKRGLTQEDLAREIGVSLSTVQRWEKKGGNPLRIIARELSRLFQEAGVDGETRLADEVRETLAAAETISPVLSTGGLTDRRRKPE